MSHVHSNASKSRTHTSCLAAVSLSAVLAFGGVLGGSANAAPSPLQNGDSKASIEKSSNAKKKVTISAKEKAKIAKQKEKEKEAKLAAREQLRQEREEARAAIKAAKAQAQGQGQAQAQAQAAPKKAIILSNLTPGDFFSEEVTELGVEHVICLGQAIDPESKTTGKVSGPKIVAAIKAERGENASGWVILDYEEPFDDVFFNGPTDPRFNAMMASMIEAVKFAKAALPNCKFTYFGVGGMRYWITGGGWEKAPQWSQIQFMDNCVNMYKPLVAELDWLNPGVYDRYNRTPHPTDTQEQLNNRERIFRTRVVEVCKRLRNEAGKPDMPIIPAVSMMYEGGGSGELGKPLSTDEYIGDQVEPILAAGGDGVFIWSSLSYHSWIAGLSWVGTAAEPARNEARSFLAKLLYDNTPPSSWTTDAQKTETKKRISNFLRTYANATRTAEASVVASGGGDD